MYSLHRFIAHWIIFCWTFSKNMAAWDTKTKKLKHLPAQPMVSSSTGRDFCCFGTLNCLWFWWLWNVIHPWWFLVFLFVQCQESRKIKEPPNNIAKTWRNTHNTWYVYPYLIYIYNFVGFHRNLQANRLPFYPPCLHGSQIFKNDGFFWGESRVDEWQPTQLAGWMERQVDQFWEVIGEQTSIDFFCRIYGMFACLSSFPCLMFKCVIPFFSRFLKQEKWERSPSTATPAMFSCFLSASERCPDFFQTYPGLEDVDHV